jgi:hypothetical protein
MTINMSRAELSQRLKEASGSLTMIRYKAEFEEGAKFLDQMAIGGKQT